jgi:hypothetical protein
MKVQAKVIFFSKKGLKYDMHHATKWKGGKQC